MPVEMPAWLLYECGIYLVVRIPGLRFLQDLSRIKQKKSEEIQGNLRDEKEKGKKF